MKKTVFSICLLLLSACLRAQSSEIDSLNKALKNAKTDTGKATILYNLSAAYLSYKPDTALLFSEQALGLSKKEKFLNGESWAYFEMASAFNKMGNYSKALEFYIESLKLKEAVGEPYDMAEVNMQIAVVYKHQDEYEKALTYANIADSIIKANVSKDSEHFSYLQLYSLLNLGDLYEKDNKIDSALLFSAMANGLAVQRKDSFMIGASLNNLGNAYAKTGNNNKAFANYRKALPYLELAKNEDFLCESTLGLAKLYEGKEQFDSAEYFGKRSFTLATEDKFQERLLDASAFLTSHYKRLQQTDSAFKYLVATVTVKDSIYSRDRIKQLQIISTNEQLRQKELADLKLQESTERSQKLQLWGIGILIPILFIITIFLSRRKIHARVIKFSGVISLLFLFEYLTLLLHPFVADKTHDSPILEILILVTIAAILIPGHHRIEQWLLNKLTEMNNLIHHKPVKTGESVQTPPDSQH